jgi:hypothetical protein
MWTLKKPDPVKLVVGILACDENALEKAVDMLKAKYGRCDFESPVWPFTNTKYYANETGTAIVKKYIAFEKLIQPDKIADIKLKTNKMEEKLAKSLGSSLSRPVNLDPGYIEPSKLVLASTKNFSHRIYLGKKIWAEVTLVYSKKWISFDYTFPDHREDRYHAFFSQVRERIVEQLRR